MSLGAMLAVMKLPAGSTTTSERLLLLAMAESASEDGELSAYCRSQAFLAFKCGWVNADTVRKLLRSLELKGLIVSREAGAGRSQSSYQLAFLDTVPGDNLPKLFWALRKQTAGDPSTSMAQPPPFGGDPSPPNGGDHISVVPTLVHHEKPARARGLKKWFTTELWPRFPDPVDRHNTWREIELLNPDEALRAEIVAGLDRAIARQEREAAESLDGFVRALPTPRNWLRGRRWEDGA